MQTDIAIIGGGLSGLALALRLADQGADFLVFEARDRLGGRILAKQHAGATFDLGPSWFWPGQPLLAELASRLDLAKFDQYSSGEAMFEDERGMVRQGMSFASMQESWRLAGGTYQFIAALETALPAERIIRSHEVTRITQTGVIHFANGAQCKADRIAITAPPRVMAEWEFQPALEQRQLADLRSIPTWMAGHAKFFAAYETPFWRKKGLSGDAFSRRGPMVEIHDASPADTAGTGAGAGALFGFLGVPAASRAGNRDAVIEACLKQLGRIFGDEATAPVAFEYKDWAEDRFTATGADWQPPAGHPMYRMPPSLATIWDGRIALAGTETAPDYGGFMEGALANAEAVARNLSLGGE